MKRYTSVAGYRLKSFDIKTGESNYVGGSVFDRYSGLVFGAPVPEPATILLFGFGLLGMAGVSRRKN